MVLVGVGLVGGLGGCGYRKSGGAEPDRTIVAPTLTPHPPARYSFDDATCQANASPGPVALTKGQIYSWNGPSVRPLLADFHATTASPDLTSAAINTTVAGAVYQRTCSGSPNGTLACDDGAGGSKGWALVRAGGPLRICRDGGSFDRQSVESIGMTSLYFIQAARERYLAVTQKEAPPQPAAIALSVLPAFVTDFTQADSSGNQRILRTYFTDNLAYFPDSQMIAVFPVQADEKTKQAGFFWESSFVLGHEYGHHIDFTRHGRVLTNVGLRWDPLVHGFSDDAALAAGGSGLTERAQMAGAEAEGFADLLGYYTSGADDHAISGLPKIGRDRDIGRGLFADNRPKVLTAARLQILLGRSDGRADPTFIDIHTTGAVLGYTLNQVFIKVNAMTMALPAGASEIDQRYRLTLAFMDALVAEFAKLGPDDTGAKVIAPVGVAVEQATNAALAAATTSPSAEEVKAAVCKIVQQTMPALVPAPFAHGDHCG